MTAKIETHPLDECPHQITEYLDECPECGELSACICLTAIVKEWEVEPTGIEGSFAYRYQYTRNGALVANFGYADTYREALDRIAHAILCEEAGK